MESSQKLTTRMGEVGLDGFQESWDAYNSFLLNGSVQRFSKFLARYELYKHIIGKPGDIIEGGVFRGAGILYWAKLIQIFNPLSERKVIGFDTFEGYPQATAYKLENQAAELFMNDTAYEPVSPEEIMAIAESQDLAHRIELVKGDVTVTVKEFVQSNPGIRVALLNADLDAYYPTAAILEHIYPLIVPGGVVAIDEYGERQWGESDAVDEFFQNKQVDYQSFPWGFSPTAYIIKNSIGPQ